MENLIPSREDILKGLEEDFFDIIVIGGGATGAGVARDAILRGLKVALVEKNDFASGTSSASTKLLHGGLRYLKNYEFSLVREAAIERRVHVEIAPHLAEIKEFLVPLYKWNSEPGWMLRLGLIFYDLLAFPRGIGRHKWLGKKGLVEMLPLIENEDLKTGARYNDVQTDDARLVLSNILSAAAGGAKVANYVLAESWTKNVEDIEVKAIDQETGKEFTIKGSTLVIAGGPWTELIEDRGQNFEGKAELRPTWGSHIVLKKKVYDHPVLIVNDDDRPVFIIPGMDYDHAGTTDIDYTGHPDDITPPPEDVEYILKACNKLFPTAKYTKDDVVATFIGLRPLVSEKGVPEGKVSRDHTIFVDKDGVITVAGGKLTTYRVMAKQAVEKALKILGLSKREHRCVTDKLPLWGGNIEDWDTFLEDHIRVLSNEFDLDEKTARVMVKLYGSELPMFVKVLTKHGTKKLVKGRPWLEAQVLYSCRYELARHPIDFLRRRTTMMFEEGNGESAVDTVVTIMGDEFNWDDSKRKQIKEETLDFINTRIRVDMDKVNLES